MRQLSLSSKIVVTLLVTGLACLGAGGVIGYRSGHAALTRAVTRQLTAQREIKKLRVESYIRNQIRFTEAIGSSPETVEAAQAFIAAFHDLHADLQADPSGEQADTAALTTWYDKDFLPRIDAIAGGHAPLESIMPADPVGRRLQADYIARNPYPIGQKDHLTAAPGGSRYDAAHARFHAMMRRLAATVGFYDINLMDAVTGDVVYTVAKEADFGSNMYRGPFAQSGFAHAAQRALDPRNGGHAIIEDYAPYMPSGFAPQMFTAMPIVAGGQTIAVLVAQIDIGALNNLLTDDNRWRLTGQGETGEVQLVGEDRLLRSQSRFMAEHPNQFLAAVQANGTPASVADQIRKLGSAIMYLRLRNDAVDLAFRNQTGVAEYTDTRGVPVVFAYGPLEIDGLRWAILAKQDAAEAFAPEARLNRELLVAGASAAILLTFLALACASLFTRPLRRVLTGMQALAAGREAEPIQVRGTDEFAELGRGYNAMAAAIAVRDQKAGAAERRAGELLQNLYPAGLAERMRGGAELAAETVANVTVAVTWMNGLDALSQQRSATEMGEILNTLLDTINGVAAAQGVEPMRSLGESHIAVCGLSSPQLDHATRTLAWTQSAAMAVQRLGADWTQSISLRFGLASGEVDLLLLQRGHAAFDIWGQTLSIARRIAVETQPNSVRVSESTYTLLADAEGFEPAALIVDPALGPLATWVRPATPRGARDGAEPGTQPANPQTRAAE